MEGKRSLNMDIMGGVTALLGEAKEFQLRKRFYKILFNAKGLDFSGYDAYGPENDASLIDWKASKRANKLLVRQYVEESDSKVIFAIDVSDNMVFGSTPKLKCEYTGELVAALAYLIVRSGDKVGFLIFSDNVKQYFPPEKGMTQFSRIVDVLSNPNTYGGASNLKAVFDFVGEYVQKSVSAVILVSDFISFNSGLKDSLGLMASKHETLAIMIKDPLDRNLPNTSEEIVVEDPLTGQQLLINPKIARKRYEENSRQQEASVKAAFRETGIDMLSLTTDVHFVSLLSGFLKGRARGSSI